MFNHVTAVNPTTITLQMSNWVANSVLQREDPKSRAEVMQKMIQIGQKCRDLHNFNAVTEIVSGLENASVYRLKKTWKVRRNPGPFNQFRC